MNNITSNEMETEEVVSSSPTTATRTTTSSMDNIVNSNVVTDAAARMMIDPSDIQLEQQLVQYEKDLQSVIRVRNRLASVTNDVQLPSILQQLLPRLFRRYDTSIILWQQLVRLQQQEQQNNEEQEHEQEHAEEQEQNESNDESNNNETPPDLSTTTTTSSTLDHCCEIQKEIIVQMNGIFDHVIERVLGNPKIVVSNWYQVLVDEILGNSNEKEQQTNLGRLKLFQLLKRTLHRVDPSILIRTSSTSTSTSTTITNTDNNHSTNQSLKSTNTEILVYLIRLMNMKYSNLIINDHEGIYETTGSIEHELQSILKQEQQQQPSPRPPLRRNIRTINIDGRRFRELRRLRRIQLEEQQQQHHQHQQEQQQEDEGGGEGEGGIQNNIVPATNNDNEEQIEKEDYNTIARRKLDETILNQASWLFLDVLMVVAGMKISCQAWESVDLGSNNTTTKNDFYPALPKLSSDVLSTMEQNGSGVVMDLLLDVLLLGANSGLSEFGKERMQYIVSELVQTPLWNGSYLLHLKHVLLRYSLLPSEKDYGGGLFQKGNSDCALLLAILFRSSDVSSVLGRTVEKYISLLQTSTNVTKKKQALKANKPSDLIKPKRAKVSWDYQSNGMLPCSLSLAISLLVLVLGDEKSMIILQKYYTDHRHIWESILGPRPNKKQYFRSPLPSHIAEKAVDHIKAYFQPNLDVLLSYDTDKVGGIQLYIDLVLTLPNSGWCMQLMKSFYDKLLDWRKIQSNQQQQLIDSEAQDWIECFHSLCYQTAIKVIEEIPDKSGLANATAGQQQNDDGNINNMDNQNDNNWDDDHEDAGRRGRFGNRHYDQMIMAHRESQERRMLAVGKPAEARISAYTILSCLVQDIKLEEENGEAVVTDVASNHIESTNRTLSFTIPILLFKCTLYETASMQSVLLQLSDALLAKYKPIVRSTVLNQKKYATTNGEPDYQNQVSKLLPYLVCLVTSNSSTARMISIRWFIGLVRELDIHVTYYICSFLADDPDSFVALETKSFLADVAGKLKVEGRRTIQRSVEPVFYDLDCLQDTQTLYRQLDTVVDTIASIYNTTTSSARLQLHDNKYNMSTFMKQYSNEGSKTEQYSALHERDTEAMEIDSYPTPDAILCGICYDEYSPDNMWSLSCEHSFCKECWGDYFRSEIDTKSILTATCPQQDCVSRIDSDFVNTVHPDLMPQWSEIFYSKFIETNTDYCYCPGADCTIVSHLNAPHSGTQSISCPKCTTEYCFQCREIHHEPANCNSVDIWNQTFKISEFWVKKYTKPCPSCQVPIQKSTGCNHMTCSRCNAEFCWLCLATFTRHLEPHTCNVYDYMSSAFNDDEKQGAIFADRYYAHHHAEILATVQLRDLERNGERLANKLHFVDDDEANTLFTAIRLLVRARRFLKYSYVEAWSMRNDKAIQAMFAPQQGTLEMLTERLSRLTEDFQRNLVQIYSTDARYGVKLYFRSLSFMCSAITQFQIRIEQTVTCYKS